MRTFAKSLLLWLALISLVNPTYAGNDTINFYPTIALSGGLALAKVGQSMLLTFPNDSTLYQYNSNEPITLAPSAGVFVGATIPIQSNWGFALGLSYNQLSYFSSSGTLVQGMDTVSSDSFHYTYNVKSQQILADIKILWKTRKELYPYLGFGLGVAVNKAYDYKIDPGFLTFTPIFLSSTTTNLSYRLVAGIDKAMWDNWFIGVGYRFSDLGKVRLGSGMIDDTPFSGGLQQNHLYSNELFLQLTYIDL